MWRRVPSATRRLPSATRRCRKIDRLRHLLRQLQRAQFGRRSEKLDPEQLHLALEDIEQAIAANEADDDKKDPVGGARARREAPRSIAARFPPICRAWM